MHSSEHTPYKENYPLNPSDNFVLQCTFVLETFDACNETLRPVLPFLLSVV